MAWGEWGLVSSVPSGVPRAPHRALRLALQHGVPRRAAGALSWPPSTTGQPCRAVPSHAKPCRLACGVRDPVVGPCPQLLTFSASWAARAPMKDATGHRSPALTLANARTTSSSRGPSCAPRLRASSSTRSASAWGRRDKGSPGEGQEGQRGWEGSGWGLTGARGRGRRPRSSRKACRARKAACRLRLRCSSAELSTGILGIASAWRRDSCRHRAGIVGTGAFWGHGTNSRFPATWEAARWGRGGHVHTSAPGAIAPARPGPRSGRVRRRSCHRSPV